MDSFILDWGQEIDGGSLAIPNVDRVLVDNFVADGNGQSVDTIQQSAPQATAGTQMQPSIMSFTSQLS